MSDLDEQRKNRPGNRDRINQIKEDMDKDVLRTRIIAAIAKADQDWCSDNPLHEDMADAVIEELKLRRDTVGLVHRHVTEWITTREPRSADKLGLIGDGE